MLAIAVVDKESVGIGWTGFGWCRSLLSVYLDGRLHAVSNGYKYGPARHLEYLSALLHSFNRSVDVVAADTYRKVCDEESRKYDELEEAREKAWNMSR